MIEGLQRRRRVRQMVTNPMINEVNQFPCDDNEEDFRGVTLNAMPIYNRRFDKMMARGIIVRWQQRSGFRYPPHYKLLTIIIFLTSGGTIQTSFLEASEKIGPLPITRLEISTSSIDQFSNTMPLDHA